MILYIAAIGFVAETVVGLFFPNDGHLAVEPHFTSTREPTTTRFTTTMFPTPPLIVCADRVSNCDSYRRACTSSGSSLKWAAYNCPKTCNLCNGITTTTPLPTSTLTPLPTHLPCENIIDNCPSYGASVCSDYKEWSILNCPLFCGLCVCADQINNCAQYGDDVCSKYPQWAVQNCKSYCNRCDDVCRYETKEYYPGQTWEDDCHRTCTCHESGGNYTCSQRCPKIELPSNCYYSTTTCCPEAFCRIQGINGQTVVPYNASLFCDDKFTNCASYPEACAPQYKDWAMKYCARSCSLC